MSMRPRSARGIDGSHLGRPSGVIACVDESGYQGSVCDHAAWFSAKAQGSIELLCVSAGDDEGAKRDALATLERAASRLMDDGAEPQEFCCVNDSLAAALARLSRGAEVVVMGRQPASATLAPRDVQERIVEVVRRTHCAVCLVPKMFLPLSRALVLVDRDRPDRGFADAVATCAWLDGMDVTLATCGAAEAMPWKGAIAVELTSGTIGVRTGQACDLVVLARRDICDESRRGAARLARALLRSRLPVLVV